MIPLPAKFVVRWRWPIVVVWIAITAVLIPIANRVHEVLQVGGQKMPNAESTRAELMVRRAFTTPYAAFGVVVIKHDTLTLEDPTYQGYVDSVSAALARLPFVLQTLDWRRAGDVSFRSPDGHTTFVIAGLRQLGDNDATQVVPDIRVALGQVPQPGGGGFTTLLTGSPAFDYDTRTVVAEDSKRLERLVIPLALLLLVVAFGALVAAAVPVVVGFIAIEITLAVIALMADITPMSIFVLNITTMMGLGVGIDYSLLVVTRFREELDGGTDPLEAAVRTINTASSAVITSGATVMVGLAALMIVPMPETRSVGLGGLVVVASAILLSISFLPAVLAILGHRVDWPIFMAERLARFRSEVGWNRYALGISRHPIRAVTLSGLAVMLLAAPVFKVRIGLPVSGWLPTATDAGRGLALLQDMSQGGTLYPVRLVVTMPAGRPVLDLDNLRGLKAISNAMRRDPRVHDVRGLVDLRRGWGTIQYATLYADTARVRSQMPEVFRTYLSADGAATVYDVFLEDSVSLDGSLDVVRHVRAIAADSLLPALPAGSELLVGGFAASNLDFQDELLRRFPALVLLVLGVTGIMLGIVFRSVLVPLKAVLMNSLSVAAAFGLTVVVFQWGFGSRIIGLEAPTQAIFILGPVLVFAIVFGLSMDYEVFLLARIKEEFDHSHDNDAATVAGLSATGATITSAALIMILVFGAFAFARVLAVQLVGFGLAVAVLLDATLIRMVMVPGVMHLAGRYNWWPGYRRPKGMAGHYRRGSGEKTQP